MVKKFIAMSLSLSLCSIMTACRNNSEKEWLTEISQKATDSLLELTQDNNFIKAYTASQELTDLVNNWQNAKVNTAEIYVTDISEDITEAFLNLSGDIDYNDFSDTGKNTLYNNIGKAIPNYINGRQGTNYIALTSVLNYSVSYATEYDINNQIWFMPTDKEGLAVCVSFTNSGEDVITVNSSYLYYGDEDLKNALDSYLSYMGAEVKTLD